MHKIGWHMNTRFRRTDPSLQTCWTIQHTLRQRDSDKTLQQTRARGLKILRKLMNVPLVWVGHGNIKKQTSINQVYTTTLQGQSEARAYCTSTSIVYRTWSVHRPYLLLRLDRDHKIKWQRTSVVPIRDCRVDIRYVSWAISRCNGSGMHAAILYMHHSKIHLTILKLDIRCIFPTQHCILH